MKELMEKRKHGDDLFPIGVYEVVLDFNETYIPIHYHKEIEIVYIIKGSMELKINSNIYECNEGDIFIINSEDLHYFYLNEQKNCHWYSIVFDLSIIDNSKLDKCHIEFLSPLINKKYKFVEKIENKARFHSHFRNIASNIISEFEYKNYGYELEIKSLILSFFSSLFRLNFTIKNEETNKNNQKIDKIKNILNYIENNYSDEISVKDLADMCYYNESYFMRIFKDYTGYSTINYIKNLRLEKAYKNLIESEKSVTEISLDVGFLNTSYFIKSFREKYGKTPNELRNKIFDK